jgi:hypothetical protein
MIAEGVARLLGEEDVPAADQALEQAHKWITARLTEHARLWFLCGAYSTTVLAGVLLLSLWLGREEAARHLGRPLFEVILGSLIGGVGAFLSVLVNLLKVELDGSAGRPRTGARASFGSWPGCLGRP